MSHGLDVPASPRCRGAWPPTRARRRRRRPAAGTWSTSMPELLGHVAEVEGEAGRAAEDGGAEVLHEHELALGVAARDGDDGGAEELGPVVGAQAAGEEAVAVGDLDDVVVGGARPGQGAGHDLGPHVDVVPWCSRRWSACRWCRRRRGCAPPPCSGTANRPKGYLSRRSYLWVKGSLARSSAPLTDPGRDAGLVEEVAVEGDPLVDALDQGRQALALELPEFARGPCTRARSRIMPATPFSVCVAAVAGPFRPSRCSRRSPCRSCGRGTRP